MNRKERQMAAKYLAQENRKWPIEPKRISKEQWPDYSQATLIDVFRSRQFLIQIFGEGSGLIRMSVNRTKLDSSGRWSDKISWDELQMLKSWIGYGDKFAVEIFPSDDKIVNVANMRHLWILPDPPAFAWGGQNEDANE